MSVLAFYICQNARERGAAISAGGSPSMATFYDGSYLPPAATTVTFADLQRVEVLKGPQATLFGFRGQTTISSLCAAYRGVHVTPCS